MKSASAADTKSGKKIGSDDKNMKGGQSDHKNKH
jgi:hypothetical protein